MKNKPLLMLSALAACLIFFPKLAWADTGSAAVSYPPQQQSAPNGARLNLTLDGQNFPISQAQADDWFGQQTVTPSLMFNRPPLPLRDMLKQSLGIAPQTTQVLPIYHYRLSDIYNFLRALSDKVNRPAVEPVFQMADNRVATFTPAQTGLALDIYQNSLNTLTALELGQHNLNLVSYRQEPKTALAQTNNLGISELIGEGVSNFKGSPNNRRHNIAVGLEKFKGLIIPQGATFSFDDNLGPVTADAGFLPELVIDNGTTLPELGGGLCQVSTTTFRAAMAAGLPITARRNHAYAVTYYSPQGTDATIYPGSADLKFVNDTPGAILIWPYEKDSNTLVFDFYGTSDNRTVILQQPVVYDKKADQSMKATWTRIVTAADGNQRTDVFKSTYQSPALFHKTETFVSATGSQSSGLKMPKT
ncbi:MAG: VanW family protein [Candidatus Doudnabacteria bacterium]|nr:VanW family protein [Candidatus Doudnabacteria bacterium]